MKYFKLAYKLVKISSKYVNVSLISSLFYLARVVLPQIIAPADKEIQKCILECLEPRIGWEVELSPDTLNQSELDAVVNAYYSLLQTGVFNPEANAESQLNITYTAMHGVGYPYIVRAFEVANFKVK